MKNSNDGYKGRGIHNLDFFSSLKSGNLNKMLEIIRNDKDLDLQIREDYLNIYYLGGNIAKVNSENSIDFNEFYFYLGEIPSTHIKHNQSIVSELKKKRDLLKGKFKNKEYQEFFSEAKMVMDKWFAKHPNPERKEQHELSLENQFNKSDYTIIDLEYKVSTLSSFACTYIPIGKVNPKIPVFDIIAVNKQGKLCIIELKKGSNSLNGPSGLQEHWDCYQHSIDRNIDAFKKEMQEILQQKIDFGFIDKNLQINSETPEFMFAFAYDNKNTIAYQDSKFQNAYEKIGVPIPVIKLKDGSKKLMD